MSSTLSNRQTEIADTIGASVPAPSASSAPRLQWQPMALILGGLLFAAGNLLHPLQHNDAAYDAATWEAAHLTVFFSLPLLALGMPALYRCLKARGGSRLATWSVGASVSYKFGAEHASLDDEPLK